MIPTEQEFVTMAQEIIEEVILPEVRRIVEREMRRRLQDLDLRLPEGI